MNIGKAIQTCRSQRDLSQQQLATEIGLSKSYLSLIESGKRELSLARLNSIADVLQIPVELLVFLGSEEKDMLSMPDSLRSQLSAAVIEVLKTRRV